MSKLKFNNLSVKDIPYHYNSLKGTHYNLAYSNPVNGNNDEQFVLQIHHTYNAEKFCLFRSGLIAKIWNIKEDKSNCKRVKVDAKQYQSLLWKLDWILSKTNYSFINSKNEGGIYYLTVIADDPSVWIIQIIYDIDNNSIIRSNFNNKSTERIVSLAPDWTSNKAVVIYESYVMLSLIILVNTENNNNTQIKGIAFWISIAINLISDQWSKLNV